MTRPPRAFDTGTLVIGAGLAGLSSAYHLALAGESVTVLETEAGPGRHASGRNAGMIRQAVADPVLAHLAREGREALERVAGTAGWRGLRYDRLGSLLLARSWDSGQIDGIATAAARAGVGTQRLTVREAARRVPALKGADFEIALFCPSDGYVSVDALLKSFVVRLRKLGVRLLFGRPLVSIVPAGTGFTVAAGGGTRLTARRLVNAGGAWAVRIAAKAGATPVPLKAYRRHLYLAPALPGSRRWPFVWDLSHNLYFRPVKEGMLLSPCDKELFEFDGAGALSARRAEASDPQMKAALAEKLRRFSPALSRLELGRGKAGLRTMTADGRFVIGEDTRLPGFFWAAGLGGHGVTTSFAVGRLVSRLVRGEERVNPVIVKALTPGRFVKTPRGAGRQEEAAALAARR